MIINGDCIEEMQKLIDEGVQVDSVVTDPPYHSLPINPVDALAYAPSVPNCAGAESSLPNRFTIDVK